MLTCAHCGFVNQPDAMTCVRCDFPLALVCPACQQAVPPNSKFCNHCGHLIIADFQSEDTPKASPISDAQKSDFAALSERKRIGRVPRLRGIQGAFIGREPVLQQLLAAVDAVRQAGEPAAVLLSGDSGVGKSRLVLELRKVLQGQAGRGTAVYEGWSLSYARSRPYWVTANILRSLIGVTDNDPATTQFDSLRAYLQELDLWVEDVWPYLTYLLGLKQDDAEGDLRLRVSDAGMLQRLTFAALRRVVLAEAALTPVVIVFEDLHWIDATSGEFLQHLIQSAAHVPLLLLLVSRNGVDEILGPLTAVMQQTGMPFNHIALAPLTASDGYELVTQLLHPAAPEVDDLKTDIARRAAGNPFYTEEIIRILIEEDGLVQQDGVWQPSETASDLLSQIPDTLRGLILARFDSLAVEVRQTLQKAAVFGAEFPLSLLAQLYDGDPAILQAHLREAEDRLFLLPQSFGDQPGCVFRHSLIQETIYETLLPQEQRQLHERIALIIETGTQWTPDEKVELLAYHYDRSTQTDRAIHYLLEAADNAARRYANETAVHHYRHILTLLDTPSNTYNSTYFRTRIGLGQSLKQLGEFNEAREILSDALQAFLRWSIVAESSDLLPLLVNGLRELADVYVREGTYEEAIFHLEAGVEALGDVGREEHTDIWLGLVERLAFVRMRQGQLDSAFALAHMGTTEIDIRKAQDLVAVADLYNTLGGITWQQGNLDEAIFYVGQSLEPYNRLGYVWGTANAYSNLGVLYAQQGKWHKTLTYWEQALQLRQEIGDIQRQALSLANLAQLRLQMGDFAQAQADLAESQRIFERLGDNWGLTEVHATQGELALLQGDVAGSSQHVDASLKLAREVGSQDSQAHALRIRALVEAARGDVAQGLQTAVESLNIANPLGLTDLAADSSRTLGVLYLAEGNTQEAETRLRESLEMSRQIRDPYRQGLALLELGGLYRALSRHAVPGQEGQYKQTQQVLQEAIGLFRRLGAAHDLIRAEELLAELQSDWPAGLVKGETAVSISKLPLGERRTATILWVSLGFPPHASEEAVFSVMTAVLPAMTTIVQKHQGHARQHPEGLEAIFGAPIAHEHDAENAVQAAYDILQHLQQTQVALNMQAHIGMSQGAVVVNPRGGRRNPDLVILGDLLHRVQRMASQAPAGKIWVTESIHQHTHRLVNYQPVVAPQLLGVLWELVSLRPKPTSRRGFEDRQSRFVGRDAVLRQMLSLSLNLARGMGGLLLLDGEAGVGKSRLTHEFYKAVTTPDRLIWTGACSLHHANKPFHLFADLFARVFHLQLTDTPEEAQQKIRKVMASWSLGEQEAVLPYLEMLLSLQPVGLEGLRLQKLEPDQLRRQIFVAVRTLFQSLAKKQSVVLILDNLQWIDSISAELLMFIAPMVTTHPILFVGAQRRQGGDATHERLLQLQGLFPGQTIHLLLPRLSAADGRALVQDLFAATDLPADVVNLIVERSEGNPYFIEEFVRMFVERDYVVYEDGRWQIAADLDLQEIKLPSSLDALIRARLEDLPPELMETIRGAAVIGREFDAILLMRVTKNPQAQADLQQLASRLIITPGKSNNQWCFAHALFESVVYDSMSQASRQRLHEQTALLLEHQWVGSTDEHAVELAYHFLRAGRQKKAIPYLLTAGEQAAIRYANEEAQTHFRQAAKLMQSLEQVDPNWQWRMAVGLGDVYRLIGRYDESSDILHSIFPLAETGDFSQEQVSALYWHLAQTAQLRGEYNKAREYYEAALTSLGDPDTAVLKAEASRILTGKAWLFWAQGEFIEAQKACEAALDYAQKADDLGELASVENLLGGIFYRQGDWRTALHHTTRAMVLREQMGYSWGVASTLSNLGVLAFVAGHWHKALSFFKRSLALRQEIGDVKGMIITQNNLGNLLRDQGDLEEAESYLQESLKISQQFQMPYHSASAYDGLASVLLFRGELPDALQMIEAGITEALNLGALDLLAYMYRIQAEIFLAQGRLAEALAKAEQAAQLADEVGNLSYEAAGWRVAAQARLKLGDLATAQECVDKAKALLAQTTDELESALLSAAAGEVYWESEQFEKAEAEIRAARNVFGRLGARLYLQLLSNSPVVMDTGT
ncbi:MAG: tetratricopeptide repeat protein [Ardenticatenaceae bacterium]|nr:tetratricopeptide repeat protein [Anaerolineales bacterium]MCB8921883.1 tetratricopeptide repeat protein [Ardenticatenaceae bacterium]MCB8992209.1 tetratricopeptide repeat protein [Ardenticatenaceae bacterium]